MAKKNPDKPSEHPREPEDRRSENVTYASVKIDDELPPIVREAAAKSRVSVQEWMSRVINEAAACELGRDPIQRRTPPRGR